MVSAPVMLYDINVTGCTAVAAGTLFTITVVSLSQGPTGKGDLGMAVVCGTAISTT